MELMDAAYVPVAHADVHVLCESVRLVRYDQVRRCASTGPTNVRAEITFPKALSKAMPKANYSTRCALWQRNWLSKMWENCCCFCLCHAFIIPFIVMRIYRDCGGHKQADIRSFFRIHYYTARIRSFFLRWCARGTGAGGTCDGVHARRLVRCGNIEFFVW